jgi:hypothetical protein
MPPSTQQIADALGFSLEELALNRAGSVSWRQLTSLFASTFLAFSFALLAAAILVFVGANGKTWMIVPYGLLSVVVISLFGWLGWESAVDLFERKVHFAEGPVQFKASRRGVRIVIGTFRGGAWPNAATVLPQGGNYRLYYLPHSDSVLSIEPIDSAETPSHLAN